MIACYGDRSYDLLGTLTDSHQVTSFYFREPGYNVNQRMLAYTDTGPLVIYEFCMYKGSGWIIMKVSTQHGAVCLL